MTKHRTTIVQRIYAARYYYEKDYDIIGGDYYTIRKLSEYIEDKTLWSGELSLPVLKEGELFKLDNSNKTHVIKEVIRSTDDCYICVVKEIEVIEDEKSKTSREQAEREQAEENERKQHVLEKSPKRKNWFQF